MVGQRPLLIDAWFVQGVPLAAAQGYLLACPHAPVVCASATGDGRGVRQVQRKKRGAKALPAPHSAECGAPKK